ncbi:YaaL family protein [Furfurilactobacillus siliginis]|uniref:DUF2508 domain-containing protein n=1 Tax=Furfurilactobacillus siliginis TaxID=348151 RepID=A0A0R2LA13_9LACO|nr:YaaL family protein [Furfurilactobacillus siliginis]KRN96566.1 hypothetical protein IV55_GL001083 [Furfurilactobacillus siliginis]GEK29026.1 hypothetical protein LSI01_13370 [Furfurilactobacillus siliginis]
MFFFKKEPPVRSQYNAVLLDDIDTAKRSWNRAAETEEAVVDEGDGRELTAQSELERQKYMLLFREAKQRNVRGRLQPSVFDK